MKTLILNGSPRINGNTASLLAVLRANLNHDFTELRLYEESVNIRPCIDCRACMKQKGCVVGDDMRLIYDDDFVISLSRRRFICPT